MSSLTLNWLHLITLLGALQGAILAGALVAKRRNRTANRLLAGLILSFSIFLATAIYHAAGLERQFPHFFGAGYPQPLLFGPLVYLYALTASDRSRPLTRRDALHFVPFLGSLLVGLPLYLSSGAEKLAFYQQLLQGQVPLNILVQDVLKFVSGIIYATITLVFLLRHRERVKASYSSTERVNLQWLVWLGAAAAFIWAMAVAFQLVQSAGVIPGVRADDYIALAIAILVYGIGYMGLKQPEIFRFETAEYPIQRLTTKDTTNGKTKETANERSNETTSGRANEGGNEKANDTAIETAIATATGARYERSGLTDRQAERLKDALLQVMEKERPWQNSELTLPDLADRLDTTPHKLSEVLNSQIGQTFYDFVNGYRVREVQRRIAAGEARQLKILTLALDAGFASKSTFNTVFKKHTSLTPSDYRQTAGA
jgi:AraC-like DNA-binding protein